MIRNQTFHEALIPLLVEGIGAHSYLELGTHLNETIAKVKCPRRYGVDKKILWQDGIEFFEMTTQQFIKQRAAKYAPYDVVFIDANHSAEAVNEDFFGIIEFVSPEGLVLLHDVNPETIADTAPGFCGDAWKLPKELLAGGFEMVVLPYHPGLCIIRNRVEWGPKK